MRRFFGLRFSSLLYKFTWIYFLFLGYNKDFILGQAASTCTKGYFDCGLGKCIHENKVCNGHNDCSNEKDELGCVCRAFGLFYCHISDKCLYIEIVCDGQKDCEDGSDELDCSFSSSTLPVAKDSEDNNLTTSSMSDITLNFTSKQTFLIPTVDTEHASQPHTSEAEKYYTYTPDTTLYYKTQNVSQTLFVVTPTSKFSSQSEISKVSLPDSQTTAERKITTESQPTILNALQTVHSTSLSSNTILPEASTLPPSSTTLVTSTQSSLHKNMRARKIVAPLNPKTTTRARKTVTTLNPTTTTRARKTVTTLNPTTTKNLTDIISDTTSALTTTLSTARATIPTTTSTQRPNYITSKPRKLKDELNLKKSGPNRIQLNKNRRTQTALSTQEPFRSLLQCNEAGMDEPHKWKSHNYCPCKKFVTGKTCDRCDKQSFHLSKENKFGCLRCFCMNVSRSCKSSALTREKISIKRFPCKDDPSLKEFVSAEEKESSKEVSCRLPDQFLGDRITSYGGVFRLRTKSRLKSPIKMYLKSNDWVLEHKIKRVPKRRKRFDLKIKFREEEWALRLPDAQQRPATRPELLVVLSDLQSIVLISRTWKRSRRKILFRNLSLDIATNSSNDNTPALEIENCVCPIGYTGSSCHLCAPGFEKRKVQSDNPDDIYFVCRNETRMQKIPEKEISHFTKAFRIIFMLKTRRETNVLSLNLTKALLRKKMKPLKLYMLRNNSVTLLSPYKQTPLKNHWTY